MFRNHPFRTLPLFFLICGLVLSGCAPLIQPVTASGTAPTPVVFFEAGGVDNPDIFVDPAFFQPALLQALAAQDTEKLQLWMAEPFLSGTWRGDMSETSPADALKSIYADQLSTDIHLALVKGADLKALMGGTDPLSIPRNDTGVMYTFLVSGWGKDGRDEAVLFISRMVDNSLKWHGLMRVKGGFSGARLGGVQHYQTDGLGFSLFMPKDYQVSEPTANDVTIVAPQVEGAGHPGVTFIRVEPANGQTAEQITQQVVEKTKAELGPGNTIAVSPVLNIEDEPAYAVNHMPGQDPNRQVFIVHNDVLYQFTFSPESSMDNVSTRQMEDAYATIMNTFHFTK